MKVHVMAEEKVQSMVGVMVKLLVALMEDNLVEKREIDLVGWMVVAKVEMMGDVMVQLLVALTAQQISYVFFYRARLYQEFQKVV